MRIYLCLIIVNSRELISVKAFTSKLKFLVPTLILMFFFFRWTIIHIRELKIRNYWKKKFPEIVMFPSFFFFFFPPSFLSRHDKTFSIIRYFYLYFIVHDYSV